MSQIVLDENIMNCWVLIWHSSHSNASRSKIIHPHPKTVMGDGRPSLSLVMLEVSSSQKEVFVTSAVAVWRWRIRTQGAGTLDTSVFIHKVVIQTEMAKVWTETYKHKLEKLTKHRTET